MPSWREMVLEALRQHKGPQPLDDIYRAIERTQGEDLPPSWRSIIRRTLGDYSPSSEHFRGIHLFDQVGPGTWVLNENAQGFEDEGLDDEELAPASSELLEKIEQPFDPLEIKINRRVVTIGQVVRRIGFKEIELAPDFQRRARIWDVARKSRLIESIMLRIPLPVFYVAADAAENWRVVDGLQRLTTISDFMDREQNLRFCLRGMEYLSDYEGLYFDELPRGIIRRIEETELNINIIESGTPEQVMFNIFKRLNTGGVSLNGQEIRHALNPGVARDFLLKLSQSDEFIQATANSVSDTRMGARELALRFVAFYITPYSEYAEGDLDGFLNQAMVRLNKMPDDRRREIEDAFRLAMLRAHMIFDDDSFRKRYDFRAGRNPINRALFEAWSVALARLNDEQAQSLGSKSTEVRMLFANELQHDPEFDASISVGTGSRARVLKRFSKVQEIIARILNA